LLWELGWTFGHKIGKADEYVQYRRLFRADDDFHREIGAYVNMSNTLGYDNRPDNWLTGRQWFLRGEELVDSGVPIRGRLVTESDQIKRGKAPLIFHSHPPKWLMSYAAAIEEEGNLGEKAQIAWKDGGDSWNDFGNRPIGTSYGFTIRLNDTERLRDDQKRLLTELDSTVAGVRERLMAEKKEALKPEEREALDTPLEARTEEQVDMVDQVRQDLIVTHDEVADHAPPDVKQKAKGLARELLDIEARVRATESYREQVAYVYWKTRCDIEQTDTAIQARRTILEADQAYERTDLLVAKQKYEQAWNKWAEIYTKYPAMVEAPDAEDIYDAIMRYKEVLGQLDEPWPPQDFQLNALVKYYDETFRPADDSAEADASSGKTASDTGPVTTVERVDRAAPESTDEQSVDKSPELELDIPD
jgi:hypothetical protein